MSAEWTPAFIWAFLRLICSCKALGPIDWKQMALQSRKEEDAQEQSLHLQLCTGTKAERVDNLPSSFGDTRPLALYLRLWLALTDAVTTMAVAGKLGLQRNSRAESFKPRQSRRGPG